jgi:hypothetical protein
MMNASSPSSRGAGPFRSNNDHRLEASTRAALSGSIVGNRASPFSRRELLKAGAASLVGLGLPLVAPPRARAQTPGPVLFAGTNGPNMATLGVTITSGPTFSVVNGQGQVCVSGVNHNAFSVVLVWDILNAPNANAFTQTGFNPPNFLIGQELLTVVTCTVGPGQTFGPGSLTNPNCGCVSVPNVCFQGDFGSFQADFGAFQADLALQNPGLVGTPILIPSSNNVAAILVGGNCDASCCIRMTGGGQTVPIFSLSGAQVSSQGFQLRTGLGAHSNLEVNFGGTVAGQGVNNFHSGPPDGISNLMCAFTPCAGGGGGGQPLNNPNTIFGLLIGTLNGQPATAFINFVDCGEPGVDDTREIAIWLGANTDGSGAPVQPLGTPVIFANGTIEHGNNQAHDCNS